ELGNLNWFQFAPANSSQPTPVAEVSVSAGGSSIVNGQVLPIFLGSVEQGSTAPTLVVEVRNDGTDDLLLETPSLPNGFTLVEGLNDVLVPGASDTFTIRLDTSSIGEKGGLVS